MEDIRELDTETKVSREIASVNEF
jgi:hypothetical protein